MSPLRTAKKRTGIGQDEAFGSAPRRNNSSTVECMSFTLTKQRTAASFMCTYFARLAAAVVSFFVSISLFFNNFCQMSYLKIY